MTRRPRFAGSWYPGEPGELRKTVEGYVSAGGPASPAVGLISPHAGYLYSGAVAGKGFAAVGVPPSVAVLWLPFERGGSGIEIWDGDAMATPLGEVEVDGELRDKLVARCPEAVTGSVAHEKDHANSLELQLPFLQVLRPEVRIVSVAVWSYRVDALRSLGDGLAAAFRECGVDDEALIVASTDMTHYVPADLARAGDDRVIERLEAMDPEGLLETAAAEESMCAAPAVAAMLFAAKALGATRAERIAYATSGDATGDKSSVVGYAAAAVRR
jgi:AmmeMemoRadiSam system protein B